jgi:hypothetical protein
LTYLVNHHNAQQIANCREEQAVKIMADSDTDLRAESVEKDLTSHKKEDTKRNIAERPSVLQCPSHKQNLHGHVHEKLDGIQEIENNEQSNGVGRSKSSPALESCERNEEADGESSQRTDAHHPY